MKHPITSMLAQSPSYMDSLQASQISRARFESGLISSLLGQFSEKDLASSRTLQLDICACALKAAGHGLLPGPHCAIVKRGNTVHLMIQYQGIIHRISQMEGVDICAPQIIYAGDKYHLPKRELSSSGPSVSFYHEQQMETDDVRYSYVQWARDGQWDITIIPRSRLDKIKALNPKSPAWRDHFAEMAKKHAVKVAVKYLDIDPGFASAIHESDQANEEAADAVVERVTREPEPVPPAKQLVQDIPEASPLGVAKPKRKRRTKKQMMMDAQREAGMKMPEETDPFASPASASAAPPPDEDDGDIPDPEKF